MKRYTQAIFNMPSFIRFITSLKAVRGFTEVSKFYKMNWQRAQGRLYTSTTLMNNAGRVRQVGAARPEKQVKGKIRTRTDLEYRQKQVTGNRETEEQRSRGHTSQTIN